MCLEYEAVHVAAVLTTVTEQVAKRVARIEHARSTCRMLIVHAGAAMDNAFVLVARLWLSDHSGELLSNWTCGQVATDGGARGQSAAECSSRAVGIQSGS